MNSEKSNTNNKTDETVNIHKSVFFCKIYLKVSK